MSAPREDMLDAMQDMADFIAVLTGIKQQLTDAGWTSQSAEQIVILITSQMLSGDPTGRKSEP